MRKYKAVVIDFKKIVRRGGIIIMAIISTAAAVLTSGISGDGEAVAERIIKNNVSVVPAEIKDPEGAKGILRKATETVLGFFPENKDSVIRATIPIYAAVADNVLVGLGDEEPAVESVEDKAPPREENESEIETADASSIKPENRMPIKSIDAAQKPSKNSPIAIGNETAYGINIGDMLSAKPEIDMSVSGPKILITHTHATESYAPKGAAVYDVTASDRSEDKNRNVVAVGRRMKAVFEECGIEVIHDEILHDVPSFNGSYAHSLASIQEYIKNNSSIQIVFDVHRDSIVYSDKIKAKTVTEINGRNAAQLMFVVGTDANGLYNPNWRSNMQAALHFQKSIVDKHPKLMRYINLRRERFNGHTGGASMIIEVGTSGNSLDEALYSVELAAKCIADYLSNL